MVTICAGPQAAGEVSYTTGENLCHALLPGPPLALTASTALCLRLEHARDEKKNRALYVLLPSMWTVKKAMAREYNLNPSRLENPRWIAHLGSALLNSYQPCVRALLNLVVPFLVEP